MQADTSQLFGTCSLYVFRLTPQGDRIGSRQDWFLNPISHVCLGQTTSGASHSFTWSTSDFPAGSVAPPFAPMGTQVRIQYVGGATVQLWLFARDAARDLLAFTLNTKPDAPGAVADGLWGCSSSVFPAILRPPGCSG